MWPFLSCRSRKSSSRKGPSQAVAAAASELDPDMPEHDLEPPKFSRRALERLLYDWKAVKAMVSTGQKEDETPAPSSPAGAGATSAVYEDQAFLGSQSGTALLDKFTHCLLVKCPEGMLDRLLETLIRHLQSGVAAERYSGAPLLVAQYKCRFTYSFKGNTCIGSLGL